MANTPDEVRQMIPITEDWLLNEGGLHEDEFEVFSKETPRETARYIVDFVLEPEVPDTNFEDETAAAESIWDDLGWDLHENPDFVRFDRHPEWDDDATNEAVKELLSEYYWERQNRR